MATNKYSITLNSRLVPRAQQLHQASRVGDHRRGPRQSFESYLSDLVEVAIVERAAEKISCGTVTSGTDERSSAALRAS